MPPIDRDMTDEEIGFYDLALRLLNVAEDSFGPKITPVPFTKVLIGDKPSIIYFDNSIGISVSEKVREEPMQLVYQLAHEVCHLLYPTMDFKSKERPPTIVLNEGVSTWFSVIQAGQYISHEILLDSIRTRDDEYYNALIIYTELWAIDNDIIKKIRKIQPALNKVTKDDFTTLGLQIPEHILDAALAEF